MNGATNLGWQLQFPLVVAAIVLLVICGFISLLFYKRAKDQFSAWSMGVGFSFGGAALAFLILIGMLIPFAPKYWNWYAVDGTLQNVTAAVQSDGDDVTNNFTVKLSGHDDVYVTENPRIRQYIGQPVELVCGIEWVPQGADAYNCNIRKAG